MARKNPEPCLGFRLRVVDLDLGRTTQKENLTTEKSHISVRRTVGKQVGRSRRTLPRHWKSVESLHL